MSKRRIMIHAGTNRSPAVVARFRARRSFFSARPQKDSLRRVLTATPLQSTTQPRLRESNGHGLRRRGFDSLPTTFGSAQNSRALRASSRGRGFTKSQQEKIMKYLLLIAAIMTLTSATTISSSDAGCCGGGACCPGACCMTMTR